MIGVILLGVSQHIMRKISEHTVTTVKHVNCQHRTLPFWSKLTMMNIVVL